MQSDSSVDRDRHILSIEDKKLVLLFSVDFANYAWFLWKMVLFLVLVVPPGEDRSLLMLDAWQIRQSARSLVNEGMFKAWPDYDDMQSLKND